MAKRDYYEILGVDRDAAPEDIKRAYRRLAMKYHPDRNAGDGNEEAEERFKEAKEAYEVLSDPARRSAYDQFGHAGVSATSGGMGGGPAPGFGGFRDIFEDVFGDIFGARAGGGSRVRRGADLRYSLELDLEDAVFGREITITVPASVECETCSGSGARPGTEPVTCATCHGAGQVRLSQGFFSVQQTCPQCRGSGRIIPHPCPDCHGEGRIRENKRLSVRIPPGVDTGDRIRLSGEGEPGEHGGPPGDLYVEVSVREHPIFVRDGSHLYCEVPISFATATLGGELEVPTLDGRAKLKIPPGTQSGRLFRLRGKGVRPVRGGATGDLLCRVVVETPVNLTRRQKELLRKFDESLQGGASSHTPRATSWLEGVKRFFEEIKP